MRKGKRTRGHDHGLKLVKMSRSLEIDYWRWLSICGECLSSSSFIDLSSRKMKGTKSSLVFRTRHHDRFDVSLMNWENGPEYLNKDKNLADREENLATMLFLANWLAPFDQSIHMAWSTNRASTMIKWDGDAQSRSSSPSTSIHKTQPHSGINPSQASSAGFLGDEPAS